MSASADMAPANTVILECRIAIIAAMKKVLSPNSETTITESDATKACTSPRETMFSWPSVVCSEVGKLIVSGTFVGGAKPPSSMSAGNESTTVAISHPHKHTMPIFVNIVIFLIESFSSTVNKL